MQAIETEHSASQVVPFLKWAGGKRWLPERYPSLFPLQYDRYIEPFLGSGAVFFKLQPQRAILSDLNIDLIQTYEALRDDWQKVHRALARHQKFHCREYYYQERDRRRKSRFERAARFLYLNRTCWNGLFRVNLKGEFNVPIGTKSSVLLPSDKFETISNLLTRIEIFSDDFENIIDKAGPNDFVFIDPPYTVKHNYNGFIKYNEKIFSWDDQIRLAHAVFRTANKGTKILVTNANHEAIRDLYTNADHLVSLDRHSVLAGATEARVKTSELAIAINYSLKEESDG